MIVLRILMPMCSQSPVIRTEGQGPLCIVPMPPGRPNVADAHAVTVMFRIRDAAITSMQSKAPSLHPSHVLKTPLEETMDLGGEG